MKNTRKIIQIGYVYGLSEIELAIYTMKTQMDTY